MIGSGTENLEQLTTEELSTTTETTATTSSTDTLNDQNLILTEDEVEYL